MTEYLTYKLNENEKDLYQSIEKAVQGLKSRLTVNKQINVDVKKVYEYFLYDHPEYFYIPHTISFMISSSSVELNFEYIYDKFKIKQIKDRLHCIVNELNSEIILTNDIIEKEKIIIRYIVKRVKYKVDNVFNQNAAAALYFNTAQCSGFSAAFKYLCDCFGIWCITVFGEHIDKVNKIKEPHSWNIIKMNNNYYHVDVTMMTGANSSLKEPFNYYNINCSDLKFMANYIWDRRVFPKCNTDLHIVDDNNQSTDTKIFTDFNSIDKYLEQESKNNHTMIEFNIDIQYYSLQECFDKIGEIISNRLHSGENGIEYKLIGNTIQIIFK